MFIEDEHAGGITVLKVVGAVKVGETVREFEQSLERAATDNAGAIVLDLTNLEYMDSTVIGVLVGALHRLKGEGRDLVLVKPRERIASLLRTAKLDSLFEIYETVAEAIGTIANEETDTDAI
jgi:anti-sigma B factor antagonist